MFHATMRAAIDGARTLAQMDELSRQIWQAAGSGAVGEEEAQALAEALHVRRLGVREAVVPVGIPVGRMSLFPPKRYQRTPDRAEALARRRRLAFSGPLPPILAHRFTTGQLAVLRIIGDEVAERGVCGLCVDAIAARAGVCRRLVQATIRLAEGDGLLVIQERRHQGRKNDPNLLRIISREWQAWLKRGRRGAALPNGRGTGCRTLHPTDTQVLDSGKSSQAALSQGLPGGSGSYRPRSQPRIRAADTAA